MLQTIGQWAPTLLLAPNEGQFNTRMQTVDLLKKLLFTQLQDYAGDQAIYRRLVLAVQELATSCSNFVQQNYLAARSRDETNLQPGQVGQVMDVVEHCLQYFDLENAADEEKIANMQTVMAQVKAKADSAVETLSSADWQDNSSEMAEMSADEYEDALSP